MNAYFADQSEENHEHMMRVFFTYASLDDHIAENVNRIVADTYQGLELLEQLFIDRDNLAKLLDEVFQEFNEEELPTIGPDQEITSTGLVNQIQGIWRSTKLSPEEKFELYTKMLQDASPDSVREQIISKIEDEELAVVLERVLEQTVEVRPITVNEFVAQVFQGSVQAIQTEQARFVQRKTGERIILDFRVVKGIPHGLWGLNCGVCVAPDLDLWNNKDFFLLALIDRNNGMAVGYVHLLEQVIDGQKVLTVPGIEPSVELLTRVKGREIYPLIKKALINVARTGGYEALYLPADGKIYTNRPDIAREVKKEKYKETTLPAPVNWNTKPKPYPFQKVFVMWENEASAGSSSVAEPASSPVGPVGADGAMMTKSGRMGRGMDYTHPIVRYDEFFEGRGRIYDYKDRSKEYDVPYFQPMQKISISRMVRIAEMVKPSEKQSVTFVEFGAGSAFGSYLLAREGHTAIAIEGNSNYVSELAKYNNFEELTRGSGIYVSLDPKLRMILIAGDIFQANKHLGNLQEGLEEVRQNPKFQMWQDIDPLDVDVVWDSFQAEQANWLESEESLNSKAIIHIWNNLTGSHDSYVDSKNYKSRIYWKAPSHKEGMPSYFQVKIKSDIDIPNMSDRIKEGDSESEQEYNFILEYKLASTKTDDLWSNREIFEGNPRGENIKSLPGYLSKRGRRAYFKRQDLIDFYGYIQKDQKSLNNERRVLVFEIETADEVIIGYFGNYANEKLSLLDSSGQELISLDLDEIDFNRKVSSIFIKLNSRFNFQYGTPLAEQILADIRTDSRDNAQLGTGKPVTAKEPESEKPASSPVKKPNFHDYDSIRLVESGDLAYTFKAERGEGDEKEVDFIKVGVEKQGIEERHTDLVTEREALLMNRIITGKRFTTVHKYLPFLKGSGRLTVQSKNDLLHMLGKEFKSQHNFDNAFYLIIQEARGTPISSVIEQIKNGKISEFEAIEYIWLLTQAITDFNKLGIANRDLHPREIFIDLTEKKVTIIDFNIASIEDDPEFGPESLRKLYITEWGQKYSYIALNRGELRRDLQAVLMITFDFLEALKSAGSSKFVELFSVELNIHKDYPVIRRGAPKTVEEFFAIVNRVKVKFYETLGDSPASDFNLEGMAAEFERSFQNFFSPERLNLAIEHEVNKSKVVRDNPGLLHHLREPLAWTLTAERLTDHLRNGIDRSKWEELVKEYELDQILSLYHVQLNIPRPERMKVLFPIVFKAITSRYAYWNSNWVSNWKEIGQDQLLSDVTRVLIDEGFKPYRHPFNPPGASSPVDWNEIVINNKFDTLKTLADRRKIKHFTPLESEDLQEIDNEMSRVIASLPIDALKRLIAINQKILGFAKVGDPTYETKSTIDRVVDDILIKKLLKKSGKKKLKGLDKFQVAKLIGVSQLRFSRYLSRNSEAYEQYRLIKRKSSRSGISSVKSSASSPINKPGGIDLNPNTLDLQTQGRRFDLKLPLNSFDLQNIRIDGFTPVIINVTPLTNLPLLLGLVDEESETPKNANHTPELDPANHKEENYLKISSLN